MSAHGKSARLLILCRAALLGLFLLVFAPLALRALTAVSKSYYTPENRYAQTVRLERLPFFRTLLLAAAALLCVALLCRLLERFARIRLSLLLTLLWTAASLVWALGVGMVQEADSGLIMQAARAFAAGDYSPLRDAYFNIYTYQLRICLPLEALMRLFPGLDANLLMQCVQAALGAASMGVMAALCELLAGQTRARYAAYALYLTFLPMFFFCTFIYNIQLMLLFSSGAMLCFALYVRRGGLGWGVGFAVLAALAVTARLNAMVPLLALLLCAALHAILRRDKRILACAALSLALATALPWAVARQYELRGGVTLRREDVSTAARLTMGLQADSPIAPGWFNGYLYQFLDRLMTAEEEDAIAAADLSARLREMAQSPAESLTFLEEKCLTQWLEPTYEILWRGCYSVHEGRFNGLCNQVCREGYAANRLLTAFMTAHQRMVYLLALLGAAVTLRRRGEDASQLMLPATILGGFLYHMLFEAKAQYVYVYAFYMMPLAAQGLCALADAAARIPRRALQRGRRE